MQNHAKGNTHMHESVNHALTLATSVISAKHCTDAHATLRAVDETYNLLTKYGVYVPGDVGRVVSVIGRADEVPFGVLMREVRWSIRYSTYLNERLIDITNVVRANADYSTPPHANVVKCGVNDVCVTFVSKEAVIERCAELLSLRTNYPIAYQYSPLFARVNHVALQAEGNARVDTFDNDPVHLRTLQVNYGRLVTAVEALRYYRDDTAADFGNSVNDVYLLD
jgi:hypothetical protein